MVYNLLGIHPITPLRTDLSHKQSLLDPSSLSSSASSSSSSSSSSISSFSSASSLRCVSSLGNGHHCNVDFSSFCPVLSLAHRAPPDAFGLTGTLRRRLALRGLFTCLSYLCRNQDLTPSGLALLPRTEPSKYTLYLLTMIDEKLTPPCLVVS